MSAFIVDRAEETGETYWTKGDNARELKVLKVWIRDGDGQAPTECEWHTIMTTQPPVPGSVLEGNIELDRNKGVFKFRKAKNTNASSVNGSGGGQRQDLSPEAQARIDAVGRSKGRCHAQEMSLRYAAIKVQSGRLDGSFTPDTLKPIIDWFYNDAQAAKEQKP